MWDPTKTLKEHLNQIIEECFLHHKGSRLNTAKALKIATRSVGNYLHRNPKLKEIYTDERFTKSMRTIKMHEWLKNIPDPNPDE